MTAPLFLVLLALDGGSLLAKPIHIKADRLDVLSKENRAHYLGHAVAVRDATTLTCDELVVHFGPKRDVETLVAKGHVEATEGDRWAAGDVATYDNRTGRLVMTGNPRARHGKRAVTGDQVVFLTGDDRLEVTRAHTEGEESTVGKTGAQKIVIDSDTLVLESDRHIATWKGHVDAKKASLRMRSPVLVATYDDAGELTHLLATGGVEVDDGDKWARGARADFDNHTGKLVMTGKPQARQGLHRMKGTRVTFYAGTDKLEVDDAVTLIDNRKKSP